MRYSAKFPAALAVLALTALVTVLLTSQGNTIVSADRDDDNWGATKNFIGLWQTIQAADGDLVTFSISDINEDGVLETRQHADAWTVCGRGFGWIVGTATIEDGVLSKSAALTCEGGDPFPPFETTYKYLKKQDILVNTTDPSNDNPERFHRISS